MEFFYDEGIHLVPFHSKCLKKMKTMSKSSVKRVHQNSNKQALKICASTNERIHYKHFICTM